MKTIYALLALLFLFPATYKIEALKSPNLEKKVIQPTHYYTDEHFTPQDIDALLASTTNTYDLRKLISCESENTNVARMDSNHVMSFGILQFNGTATWQEFSVSANVSGSPMNPPDAIKVADWMISHGFGHRWTCWKIQGL